MVKYYVQQCILQYCVTYCMIVLYVMDHIITAIFPDVGLIPPHRGVNWKHHPCVANITFETKTLLLDICLSKKIGREVNISPRLGPHSPTQIGVNCKHHVNMYFCILGFH